MSESQYAALLGELTALPVLAKSEPAAPPAPTEAEAEAAAAAEATAAAEAEAAATAEAEAAEGEAAPAPIKATLADGTEVEVEDAGPAIAELRGELTTATAALAEAAPVIATSVALIKSLHGTVSEQDAMIKSLRADVERLGSLGGGRRGVLVAPKAPAAPAAPAGTPYPDLMTKALDAQKAGKITGAEVSRLVAHVNRGLGVPEDIAAQLAAL